MAAATLALQSLNVTRRNVERTYKVTMPASAVTSADIDLTATTNPFNLETPKWARNPTGFRVDNPPNACPTFDIDRGTLLTNWKVNCTSGDYSADADVRITFGGKIGI